MKRALSAGVLSILLVLPASVVRAQDHGEQAPAADHEAAPAEGEHAEGGEHGAEPGAHHVAPLNFAHFGGETIPILAMLLNFAALLGILVWLGRRPLTAYLQARHVAIRDALAEAQKTRAEAEGRFQEYSARLDHLDRELARLREEMSNVAQAERDRVVADAEERAARLHRESDFLLGQELKQVRKDLERDLAVAAVGAAEEVLRRVTTEQDQVRLAESYLDVMGKGGKEGTA